MVADCARQVQQMGNVVLANGTVYLDERGRRRRRKLRWKDSVYKRDLEKTRINCIILDLESGKIQEKMDNLCDQNV